MGYWRKIKHPGMAVAPELGAAANVKPPNPPHGGIVGRSPAFFSVNAALPTVGARNLGAPLAPLAGGVAFLPKSGPLLGIAEVGRVWGGNPRRIVGAPGRVRAGNPQKFEGALDGSVNTKVSMKLHYSKVEPNVYPFLCFP